MSANSTQVVGPNLSLSDIQGNILKGHGRKYTALVLFQFGPDLAKNRALLRAAADPAWDQHITSAEEQQDHANKLRPLVEVKSLRPAEFLQASTRPFRSLGLTQGGLAACGYNRKTMQLENHLLAAEDFWDSAENNRKSLRDPEPWEPVYADDPHGVWLLANDDEGLLNTMVTDCQLMLGSPEFGAAWTGVERGFKWTPDNDDIGHEPFGFADGFARTQVKPELTSPWRTLLQRGFALIRPRKVEPYEIPLGQVILDDPPQLAGSSFLVLRKLDQNVQEFYRAEEELAGKLPALPHPPVEAGALFIGRERDGTPLALRGKKLADRFHFGRDQQGARCPFHAHIRKMNPRQIGWRDGSGHSMADRRKQKDAQFVRRGVVFGPMDKLRPTWADWRDAPTGGVGLLFMGYMTSINGQFLQMHQSWAPAVDFPAKDAGVDPVFAPGDPVTGRWSWKWLRRSKPAVPEVNMLARFVTPRGGAYFWVPSLAWLRQQPFPAES